MFLSSAQKSVITLNNYDIEKAGRLLLLAVFPALFIQKLRIEQKKEAYRFDKLPFHMI